MPTIEVHAMNRTDVDPAGAGETPIIAIAPAIGNAVFHATGVRLRSMPMKLAGRTVACSRCAAQATKHLRSTTCGENVLLYFAWIFELRGRSM